MGSWNTASRIAPPSGPDEAALAPLFRWPGGKRWLVSALSRVAVDIPFERYLEPFLGGAALFLTMRPQAALLADSNAELIATYLALRDDPDGVHSALSTLPLGIKQYYAIREQVPDDPLAVAARFLYLRATAFGGLYRVNQLGRFNVPYGGLRRKSLPNKSDIRRTAAALLGHQLSTRDYVDSLLHARPGDLVYADPPYVSFDHRRETFNRYVDSVFTWSDHLTLAKILSDLVRCGVFVIASNSADSKVATLYPPHLFHRFRVTRGSQFAPLVASRRAVTELLLVSTNVPRSRSSLYRRVLRVDT